MDRKKLVDPIIYLVLIIALLAPRLPGLGSYVTLDEPYWLSMGANFYYALGQREFQNTVYEYQPAVTTMWIITAAMVVYFPEYRGLGQGYLDYNKGWLDGFLTAHGKHPLELLQIARVIQVFVILALFLLLYYLLQRFINKFIAAFAILFASLDPFFLSQSRILDHEAMLSLFVLIAVLALLTYFLQGRKLIFLLVSGGAAGLAQLTKSSALAILAPIGILFLIQIYQERGAGWWKAILNNAKIFLIWLVLLVAAYVIFWPGMWVAPKKMLYEVYGNAFSYAFQGSRLAVTGDLETSRFNLNTNVTGVVSLFVMLLRRTTLLTWLGIIFGFALIKHKETIYKILFTLLWITAVAFILMFGVAQGRDSPHYILCSYLALNLLAGLGWWYVIQALGEKFTAIKLQFVLPPLLLIVQLWSALPYFPYYFTYQNPITYQFFDDKQFPLFSYGEGLEFAGQYLAGLPDAQNSTALVYYSRGCFSYFYPGTTTGFKNYYTDGAHAQELLDAIHSVNYVVVYYAVQGNMGKYAGYIKALSSVKPLHEIWLDGRKYIIIYKVDEIPDSVFQSLAELKPYKP